MFFSRSMAVLAVLVALITETGAEHATGSFHPADRPDVDLRISIDPGVVTLFATMNLAFADEVVDVPREDEWSLHELEEEPLREALVEFFRTSNLVEVGGEPAVLTSWERLETEAPNLSFLPLFPETGMKGLLKIGVKMEYALDEEDGAAPRSVGVKWGSYPPDPIMATDDGTPPIEITAQLVAHGLASVITLTAHEPKYVWHPPEGGVASRFFEVPPAPPVERLSLPVISLGLGGVWLLSALITLILRRRTPFLASVVALPVVVAAAWVVRDAAVVEIDHPFREDLDLPDDEEAAAAFELLHRNIYRAFDFTRESDVYDALARSVDGDLLEALYDQVYQGLIMREEGGVVSRVEAIRYFEKEVTSIGSLEEFSAPGFTVRARWQVDGKVFHFGHAHERTNEHVAEYTVVRGGDGGWRIAGSRMIEQFRVDPAAETRDRDR